MSKKDIVIFGCGGHAKVVLAEIINDNVFNVVGFIDKSPIKKNFISFNSKKYHVFSDIQEISIDDNELFGIIAIGDNSLRERISKDIDSSIPNLKWTSIISKNAIINVDVNIKEGTFIAPGVIINNSTTIGKHCIINTSSSIDHDNILKDFSSIAPGVTTAGNVEIGYGSSLGIGCTVEQGIKIGNNTVIGGQSYVNKNCLDNLIYFGVPAKKIKEISYE